MSGQGPYFGQGVWFVRLHQEKVQSAIDRYVAETHRIFKVVDDHLAKQGTNFLVGDKITYADYMWIPWFYGIGYVHVGEDFTVYKNVAAWQGKVLARPASQRVVAEWVPMMQAALAGASNK